MQGYNHVVGGTVFTGLFASLHDVNVLSSPGLIAATVTLSVLPDVDHTRSAIGRTLQPIARYLQARYGHRTLTHSLCFFGAVVGLLWLGPRTYAVCGTYALLSHLLFDMCTKQGVPLLYPFSKRPFVLPANPALRLSAQDHRSELIVLVGFVLLGATGRPLFANGFWTTYNEAFATWEHVGREAKRTRLLLHVAWSDNQKRMHRGYYLRAEGGTLVMLTREGFELPKAGETTLIGFSRSTIVATEQQRTVSNVPLDSLNRLLRAHCLRLQVQCTEPLTYFDGPLMKTGNVVDLTYKTNLLISLAPHDDAPTLNRIALLGIEREAERTRYARQVAEYERTIQAILQLDRSLRQLTAEYETASDYRKGQLIKERQDLTSQLERARLSAPLPPIRPDFRRFDLEADLLRQTLRHDARLSANLLTLITSKPLP